MIEQLIVEKEEDRGYIVREIICWMNMELDVCEGLSDGCDKCKLEDLDLMGDYVVDGWGELVDDGGW